MKGRWGCNKHVGLFYHYQFSVKCVLISVLHWQSREAWVVTQSQLIGDHHKSFLLGQKVMRNWDDDGEVPQVSYPFTPTSTCSVWSLDTSEMAGLYPVMWEHLISQWPGQWSPPSNHTPVSPHCDDWSHPGLVWDLAALFYDLIFKIAPLLDSLTHR